VRELYRVLRRLLGYIKPHRWTIVAGSLLALVSAAAGGVVAWLVKPVMDDIFLKHDRLMLILVPLALLGVSVVKSLARYGESYLMATVSELVIARLRRDLYTHIQSMPMAFFASLHSAGRLVSLLMPSLSGPRHWGQLSARAGPRQDSTTHKAGGRQRTATEGFTAASPQGRETAGGNPAGLRGRTVPFLL